MFKSQIINRNIGILYFSNNFSIQKYRNYMIQGEGGGGLRREIYK